MRNEDLRDRAPGADGVAADSHEVESEEEDLHYEGDFAAPAHNVHASADMPRSAFLDMGSVHRLRAVSPAHNHLLTEDGSPEQ